MPKKKYTFDKKTDKLLNNVTQKIQNQKVPGEIRDLPLQPEYPESVVLFGPEFKAYGVLKGGLKVATGLAGSNVVSNAGYKLGTKADNKFNTKFVGPALGIIGGLGGYAIGSGLTGAALSRIPKKYNYGPVNYRTYLADDQTPKYNSLQIDDIPRYESSKINIKQIELQNPISFKSDYGNRQGAIFSEKYKDLDRNTWESLMFDDFLKGKNNAQSFLRSKVKQETDTYNKNLAKQWGFDFIENNNAAEKLDLPMIKTTDGYWLQRNGTGFYLDPNLPLRNSLAQYRPGQDNMIFSGLGDIEEISMHENLHRARFGEAPWPKTIDSSEQYKKLKNTDAFYEKLTDDIIDISKPYLDYLYEKGEAATNLLEIGRRANLKLGQEYPGNEKAIEIFEEIIKNDNLKGSILDRFKWKTEPEKIWKALTGRYYTIPLIGLGINYGRKE